MSDCKCAELRECKTKLNRIQKMEEKLCHEEVIVLRWEDAINQINQLYYEVFNSNEIKYLVNEASDCHIEMKKLVLTMHTEIDMTKRYLEEELKCLQIEDKIFHEEENRQIT